MSNQNGSNWIRKDKRYSIYHRDNFCCVYCGERFSTLPAKFRTLDHVIPRELGGGNEHTNLVTCCKRCNDRKQDKDLIDFLPPEQVDRIIEQLSMPIDREKGKYYASLARLVQ